MLWPVCANLLRRITGQGVLRGRVHTAPTSGPLMASDSLSVAPGRSPGQGFPALPHRGPRTGFAPRPPVSTRASRSSAGSMRVCPNLSSGPRSPFPSLRFISGRRTRDTMSPRLGVCIYAAVSSVVSALVLQEAASFQS